MWSNIKKYFLTGLIFIVPLLTVFYLLLLFMGIVNHIMQYMPLPKAVYAVPGLVIPIFIMFIVGIGWLFTTILGKIVMSWVDDVIDRVPVIRSLFILIKQAVMSVLSDDRSCFQNVVLVEYPSSGIWSLGFISRVVKYEVEQYVDPEHTVTVFIPTSPNPASGMLVFISVKKVHILGMSVTEALNIIVSAGINCPVRKFSDRDLLPEHIINSKAKARTEGTTVTSGKATEKVEKSSTSKTRTVKTPSKTTRKTSAPRSTQRKTPTTP